MKKTSTFDRFNAALQAQAAGKKSRRSQKDAAEIERRARVAQAMGHGIEMSRYTLIRLGLLK